MAKAIICKYCNGSFFIEDKKVWKENSFLCPLCNIDLCVLPPTERELKHLQTEFLYHGRSEKVMKKFVKILMSYTRSLICKHFSNRLTFDGALDYYTHMAVTYFIECYYSREHFEVGVSFAGFLIHKIRQAVFGGMEKDIDATSIDIEFEEGTTVQYEDKNSVDVIAEFEEKEYKKEFAAFLCELLKEYKSMFSPRVGYILTLLFNHYLSSGELAVDKYFSAYNDRTAKIEYFNFLKILREEIVKFNK